MLLGVFVFFFFFQAEDGIRDGTVTGVQTCALPISRRDRLVCFANREQGLIVARGNPKKLMSMADVARKHARFVNRQKGAGRSEERRVGKECRCRWSP